MARAANPRHANRKWNTSDLRMGFRVHRRKRVEETKEETMERRARVAGSERQPAKGGEASRIWLPAEYHFFRSRKFSLFRPSTTVAAFSRG